MTTDEHEQADRLVMIVVVVLAVALVVAAFGLLKAQRWAWPRFGIR